MPAPDVRAVIFDAGGTLILPDAAAIADDLAAETGVEIDPGRLQASLAEAAHDLDPTLPGGSDAEFQEKFFPTVFARLGVPDGEIDSAMEVYRRLHFQPSGVWNKPIEGARDVVIEVRRRGFRTAVVSNSDGRVAGHLEDAGFEPDLFEFIIDSYVFGIAKPDPAIFRAAAERMQLDPSDCLYVGDIVGIDVIGAQAAGMPVVHIDASRRWGEPDDHFRIGRLADLLSLLPPAPRP